MGKEIVLPDYCYFVVRGVDSDNSFSCPVSTDRFRDVSFPTPETIDYLTEKKRNELNQNLLNENPGFNVIAAQKKQIDKQLHCLEVWRVGESLNYIYTICELSSCIKISANDYTFVEELTSNLSQEIINYDI